MTFGRNIQKTLEYSMFGSVSRSSRDNKRRRLLSRYCLPNCIQKIRLHVFLW